MTYGQSAPSEQREFLVEERVINEYGVEGAVVERSGGSDSGAEWREWEWSGVEGVVLEWSGGSGNGVEW